MSQRIGEFLIAAGKMTHNQVEQVLNKQRRGDNRRFGEIALTLGFIGDDAIKRFVDYLEQNPLTPAPGP
jgi:hypothetical protein